MKISSGTYLVISATALKDIGNVPIYLLYSILQFADGENFYTDRESIHHMCQELNFTKARVETVIRRLARAGVLIRCKERCHYMVNTRLCFVEERDRYVR